MPILTAVILLFQVASSVKVMSMLLSTVLAVASAVRDGGVAGLEITPAMANPFVPDAAELNPQPPVVVWPLA